MSVSTIEWKKPIEQIIRQDILGKDTMTFAANEAKRLMSPFTPRDVGTLEDTAQIITGETIAAVHYVQPYAAVVYYGERNGRKINIRKEKHPLATSHWDKHAMAAGGKEKLAGAVSEYIKRKRGG